jgi:hypothetical protein
MKTLTQIVLPIAFLAVLVFGIAYVLNYTSSPTPTDRGGNAPTAEAPLKFWEITGNRETEKGKATEKEKEPDSKQNRYWRDDYELGEAGHYDFWFQNEKNPQPVRLAFTDANCQCASAQICLIPPEVWAEYTKTVQPARPGAAIPHPILADNLHFHELPAAFTNEKIQQSIHWQSLERKQETTIPAATQAGPQVGILRINWTGKEGEGKKNVKAFFTTQLPGASASPVKLEVEFNVVPPFDVYSPKTHGKKIDLGEVSAAQDVRGEFFIFSRTQPELHIVLSADSFGDSKDCISLPSPVRLTDSQMVELSQALFGSGNVLRSAYQVTLIVSEHKETERNGMKTTKRLDLGPITFSIGVATGEGKGLNVPVTGVVHGEVRLIGGNSPDRIDFGNSFRSSEVMSSPLIKVVSDRADLDLAVVTSECTPDYLKVTLDPAPPVGGNKAWTLRVVIPANKLFGNLVDSYVVLKVNDGSNRRIRIPVTAKTFDDNPRL